MSISILCHGCGKRIAIADDYARRKIQCPDCGVYCDVPASAPKKAAPVSRPRRPEEIPPVSEPELRDEPTVPDREVVACRHCGERVRPLVGQVSGQRRCPSCGSTSGVAPAAAPGPRAKAARRGPPDAIESATPPRRPASPTNRKPSRVEDEDEGDWRDPYDVVGGLDVPKCPGCGKEITADVTVCLGCGCNLETGEKFVKTYEELERYWEAGLPFRTRLTLFFAGEAVVFLLGLLGAVLGGHVFAFLFSLLVFTGMTAFLLGTQDSLLLKRNRRGKTTLTKTWRVCFIYQIVTPIDLLEYEGVTTQQSNEKDFWDWYVMIALFGLGCIPGLLWWYFAIQRDTFQVALTQQHGYPECILYRGFDRERARELARTLHEEAEVPYEVH